MQIILCVQLICCAGNRINNLYDCGLLNAEFGFEIRSHKSEVTNDHHSGIKG